MLILGILATAAAPSFADSLQYHRVESAARRLKNDLELARQTSIATSTTTSLEFTTATRYELTGLASLDHGEQPYAVELSGPPYSVEVTMVDFGGATSLSFNGYGVPSSAGAIVVQAGDHRRQINVSDQGYVTTTKL